MINFLTALFVTAAAVLPAVGTVKAQLAASGPTATVQAMDADGRWDAVMDRIAAGDTGWIALAPGLAPGADAGTSEGLAIALAYALPLQPAAVLAVVDLGGKPALSPARLCSAPFIEDTPQHQHSYKAQALGAVAKVTSAPLSKAAAACRAQLLKIK